MRICSPQLGISPKSVLGGEVVDREILLGLAKNGVEVEIILPKKKPHDINVKNWKITYLPFAHFPPQIFNLLIIPYLFKINSRKKIDIIRLHQPQFTALGAIAFKLFNPNVKVIATYHKFEETNFGLFSKVLNQYWNHIICDSLSVKQKIIEKFNLDSSKISVVHNGVPSYLRSQIRDKILEKKLNLRGKIVLLFMGLFQERKNPLFLIDVLSKLSSNVAILFWGDGPLREKIIKKAKEQRLYERIKIIDPVFGLEKNKIHNLSDIFVHPSKDEGFALSPLEAMACAKPVIITNGYSAREAVEDGVNGFLCRLNDVSDWIHKLEELIKNKKLREKMGKASLEKVKDRFQWQTAVKIHIDAFNKILS